MPNHILRHFKRKHSKKLIPLLTQGSHCKHIDCSCLNNPCLLHDRHYSCRWSLLQRDFGSLCLHKVFLKCFLFAKNNRQKYVLHSHSVGRNKFCNWKLDKHIFEKPQCSFTKQTNKFAWTKLVKLYVKVKKIYTLYSSCLWKNKFYYQKLEREIYIRGTRMIFH